MWVCSPCIARANWGKTRDTRRKIERKDQQILNSRAKDEVKPPKEEGGG